MTNLMLTHYYSQFRALSEWKISVCAVSIFCYSWINKLALTLILHHTLHVKLNVSLGNNNLAMSIASGDLPTRVLYHFFKTSLGT